MTRLRMRRWATERRLALVSEDGFSIVVVMMLIVIGLLAGAAALTETLDARGNANRSQRSARALQAADAGIATELYRAGQLNFGILKLTSGLSLSSIVSQLLTCPIPQINTSGQVTGIQFAAIASVGSPCPKNSTSGISSPGPDQEPVGHHSYFQVQFVPGMTNIGDFVQFNPKIVASGVDDNATSTDPSRYIYRRVEAILAPVAPWRTLEAGNNLTFDVPPAVSVLGIKLAGATAFNGTAAAGNNLTIEGQPALANTFTALNAGGSGLTEPSALDYCGTLADGVPQHMTVSLTLGSITKPSANCSSLVNRPTISIKSTKPDCAPDTGVVSCSSLSFGSSMSTSNPDELYNTNPGTTISFQPGDYVFCNFETNGPVSVNPSSTQAVRIFIDSPNSSRCSGFTPHPGIGLPSGFRTTAGNFVATQGVAWNALSGTLSTTHPSQAQIYVVGNGTDDGTTVTSTGSSALSGQSMFLYAPTSNVTVTAGQTCLAGTCVNAGTIAGALIGWDVDVSATAVTQDLGLLNYPLSGTLGPFRIKQYIECTPQYPLPSPDPTTGC